MNNNQPLTAQSSTTPRADLLLEIQQTPEEYLPELLQFVRLFRQSVTMKMTAIADYAPGNELDMFPDLEGKDFCHYRDEDFYNSGN